LFTGIRDIFVIVAIQRLRIKEFLQASKDKLILDVRSPGEYGHAHIPSAINFPLFTDEERKIVGTTYKQKSREDAIRIGLDFFSPKMKKMVEDVEEILGRPDSSSTQKLEVFVHCWRGGMRSAAIAWLLDLYGFQVYSLAGGYKAFRNQVLETFEQPIELKLLGGYTGSGKTEVLNELAKHGEIVIDLEKLASHKGSAFGSFNMPPQPSQEMFENLLSIELNEKVLNTGLPSGTVWLEDESQRIGDLNLPNSLWEMMRKSPVIFLEIPFEERLNHLVEEYGECEKEKLIDSTRRISQRLGGLDAKKTIDFLEEGNVKEAFSILLRYYDKRYLKGLHNRENISTLLTKIQCNAVTPKNAMQLTKPQPV